MFVLKTGIAWNQLPTGLVGCSGVTCWRRLRDWTEAGVWPALHELLLAELRASDRLDLDRCAVDGSHIRALEGGTTSAPRRSTARPGSKHHLICDAAGIPLAVTLTGGNRNDITQLIPLLEAVPPPSEFRSQAGSRPSSVANDSLRTSSRGSGASSACQGRAISARSRAKRSSRVTVVGGATLTRSTVRGTP
ncbi:MAG: hypothetical protein JWP62_136 [Blastococcus sp.]|nr:hypothetical protein [Blastococcus sp.]